MISRKEFLKKSAFLLAGSAISGGIGSGLIRENTPSMLTILYTNDTHARLDPFPGNATQFSGLGGIARRASLIKKIRSQQSHVLLLDAGDVFQGTPWFDVYGGKVDLKLMTEMGYDAMTIGNHEFDRGPEGFADAAQKAGFPILSANYTVQKTAMNPFVQKFIVREVDGFRVGIFGLGIRLSGLVHPDLYGDVRHRDPVIWADGMVNSLRKYHNCDYVICLSHLGFQYNDGRIDDIELAGRVKGIDLIIGGHTHTFLDKPVAVKNAGGSTLITQAGHSGIRLGRIDLNFQTGTKDLITTDSYYTIGE